MNSSMNWPPSFPPQLENIVQENVRSGMEEMKRSAVHTQTAAMLEMGTNLLSQSAEQTRKLTDVETQVSLLGDVVENDVSSGWKMTWKINGVCIQVLDEWSIKCKSDVTCREVRPSRKVGGGLGRISDALSWAELSWASTSVPRKIDALAATHVSSITLHVKCKRTAALGFFSEHLNVF